MPRQEPGEPFFRINSEEAKQMLSDNSETAIIDVRNAEEYEGGHAQNATLIPHDQVLARFEELPKNKTLLFICAKGQRSAVACEMAAAMGVPADKLFNIEDGTPGWIANNYPVTYGKEP
ncbi:MAG: rhodanese-like domain-containing protein [Chloroflexota bacterium]|nr:rhodanese-like domain-containing protein [Chloroflexota bacterium]